MTTINISSQIPSNIDLLERHLAWAALALDFINPTIAVLETPDRAEKCVQSSIFQAADNTYRLLVRATLPLDQAYMSDRTKKLWMHVQELSNVSLPSGFTTN
jgi:hypothetical protein